ncbi:hypothetical protein SDRG_04696 [Saprolegnia diclina VS20]|uniref:Ubiquitin-like domain-containing protein n=1 Tax=Saprolegnia diclina (strain VS20) TaxID=1156394 RepID=T0QU79_SAPDV|nr:hypothetical protein SDRG_04696 [Saprolegnia diclina VS20]EQC38271.1 hypothetical protein SDRG_04696 [Saprolegnia diclina VS20]|eukprot:XP_008608598.1 hypothetical protein SDRG_04696 [Saprolegnia diclina VS20]
MPLPLPETAFVPEAKSTKKRPEPMTPQFVIQPTPKRRTAFESPPASAYEALASQAMGPPPMLMLDDAEEEATPTTPDQGWVAPLPSMDAHGEEDDLDHPPTSHDVEDAHKEVAPLRWLDQDAPVQGLVESGNEKSSADDSSQEVQGGPFALPDHMEEPIVASAAPNTLQAMPLASDHVNGMVPISSGESEPSSPVPRPLVDDAETPLLHRSGAPCSSLRLPPNNSAPEEPAIAPVQIEDSKEALFEEAEQSMPLFRTAPADASSHLQYGQVAPSPFRISQSQFGQIGKGLPTRLFSQATDQKIKPEPCATNVARANATRVRSRTSSTIAGGKRRSVSAPQDENARPMARLVSPEAAKAVIEEQPRAAKVKPISLQLRDGNGDIVLLRAKPTALLSRVFEEFSKMKKVPSDHYRFFVDGKRLAGEATIASVELEHDDIIDCLGPQVGGCLA